jgi:predicted amidohydrolase
MNKILSLIALSSALSFSAFAQVKDIKEIFEPVGNFPKEQFVKVAVVQWNPAGSSPVPATQAEAEAFKQSNRQELETYIREAAGKGAEMVITPEFGIVGYPDIPELPSEEDNFRNRQDLEPYVEPVDGKTTQYFSKLAKELGIYIHVGFAEVDKKTDEYHNTVVAIGPDGKMLADYRKVHLFEVEETFLIPGDKAVTYNSPAGKVGFIICSDVYSDFPISQYVTDGVDILALSTSWARYNTGMTSFVAAAKSNSMYLLAANQYYFPDSGVVNPDGTLQSHIRQTQGIAYGYLPRKGASPAPTVKSKKKN